jgi:ankyrin repeat protein
MAKKRTTLPKDFDELLKTADLPTLKAIFEKCALDARGGFSKQTALAYDNCPHKLAIWLVEQGADLDVTDSYGYTPLHSRSRSIHGNIKSLLALGADVNNATPSIGTPLHSAADAHNIDNTALLLEYGASIDMINKQGFTALEQALLTCNNIDIVKTLAIGKLHLTAGARNSPRMSNLITEIGKRFEFHRAGFNKDFADEGSRALDELYRLFGVEPVAKRLLHDGKSPIHAAAAAWPKQHQELWELLVPSSGPAGTMQGEVIRITGRIAHELDGNGGGNWDDEYKKMADAFLTFVQQGQALPGREITEAAGIVTEIKRKAGEPDRLCELGVQWVLANPQPLPLPPVDYKR